MAQTGSSENAKYCSTGERRFRSGATEFCIHVSSRETYEVLSPLDVMLLDFCREAKPISEHMAAFCGKNRGLPAGEIEPAIRRLADAGLLVSVEDLDALRPQASDVPRISTLAVPTCARPDFLARALLSFAERSGGCVERYLVTDDSRDRATGLRNREALRSIRARLGAPIFYADRDERRAYCAKLSREAGAPAETVEFALLGSHHLDKSYGANANSIQLDTAGELYITMDEDMVSELYPIPGALSGKVFTGSKPNQPSCFFRSRAELEEVASRPTPETDVYSLHSELLGKHPLAGAELTDARNLSPGMFAKLQLPQPTVLVTQLGILGNSAVGGNQNYFFKGGITLDRLVVDPETYREALLGYLAWRGVERRTVSAAGGCMTFCTGFDNREMLPPFFPNLRGHDDLFGACLDACAPSAFFGYLPYAIGHFPEERRITFEEFLEKPSGDLVLFYVMSLVSEFPAARPGSSLAEGLAAFGQSFGGIAAMPHASFLSLLREMHLKRLCYNLLRIEENLSRQPAFPEYVRQDLARLHARLRREVTAPSRSTLWELPEGSVRERCVRMQALIAAFGSMLQWWPDIVAAAKKLKGEGITLSGPLEAGR